MSPYRVEFRPAAMRVLRKRDPPVQKRLHAAIALLAQDPRPTSSRPLKGRPGYRVRVGEDRVIYTIRDDVLLVIDVTDAHRRDVYEH